MCMCVHVSVRVCARMCMSVCARVYVCVRACVSLCARVRVCACVPTSVSILVLFMIPNTAFFHQERIQSGIEI